MLDSKVDGCYGILDTASSACISSLISRTGQAFGEANELMGKQIGLPDSTLVGEWATAPSGRLRLRHEVMTQHALDVVKHRGIRCYWPFDVVRLFGQDVRDKPLEVRRALLERAVETIRSHSTFVSDRIFLVEQVEEGFAAAYKRWKAEGHEGAVAKKRGSK